MSSPEKSVTVQKHKITKTNKETVIDISKPCLSACMDNHNNNNAVFYSALKFENKETQVASGEVDLNKWV